MSYPHHARTTDPLIHQEYQMTISQDDHLIIDPALDRLVTHVNAAADRAAPAVDVENLLANVYAQIAEEDRALAAAQAAADPDLGDCDQPARALAMALARRTRVLRASAARLARRVWYDCRPSAQAALFVCAAYSIVLMVSVGYELQLLSLLGSFVTGVATAIAVSEIGPEFRAALRCRRLGKRPKWRARDCSEQEPLSDTPIFDLTADLYCIDLKSFPKPLGNDIDECGGIIPLPRSMTKSLLSPSTLEEQSVAVLGGCSQDSCVPRFSLCAPVMVDKDPSTQARSD
jgi:hypothetical protein